MSYYIIKYEFMGQDSAGLRGGEGQFQVSKFFEPTCFTGIFHGQCLMRFPSKHTYRLLFPVGLSVTAPYNDVCADLDPLHSGFSAVPRPIPVILHGNQSILMIQS